MEEWEEKKKKEDHTLAFTLLARPLTPIENNLGEKDIVTYCYLNLSKFKNEANVKGDNK